MFRNLKLQPVYTTEDNRIVQDFYNPVLREAIKFDRTSGFFSGEALAKYAEGLEFFGNKGYKYRLVVSKEISESDYNEIKLGYKIKESIRNEMLDSLSCAYSITEERQISNLAYLIAKGIVDIKIAFKTPGIFHDKCGILTDYDGNKICFRGSNNETPSGLEYNYETFQITCSWLDCNGFYSKGIADSEEEFEQLWNNKKNNLTVLPMDEVVIKEIIKHNKGELIVEDVLLKDNAMVLDYNGQLVLHLNSINIEDFIGSSLYKIRLKSYVNHILGNTIFFSQELVYTDYIQIASRLSDKAILFNCDFYETQRLKDYIEERHLHIQERSRLGNELKTNPEKHFERYSVFKNIVDESMNRKLRDRQMWDAFFMYAIRKAANFSVPGSGKTASVLGVFAFLQANDLVDRIVMIGPKNSFGSWIDEFHNCFGEKKELKLFNIHDPIFTSKKAVIDSLKYKSAGCNLLLFNYESLGGYEDILKQIVSSRTLLVFDEVHKAKNINGVYSQHAINVARFANYTIALTGTPIPNSYCDIYNLLHILYYEEYREFFGFSPSFLGYPTETQICEINNSIQPFFCRTTKADLSVPKPNTDILLDFEASQAEQRLYEIICKKYRDNQLALFIRLLQLESNPKMLLKALDAADFDNILDIDFINEEAGFVDFSNEIEDLVYSVDITTKKTACLNLVESLVEKGKSVVVWGIFIDSIESISQMLSDRGIRSKVIYGGVPLEERQTLLNDFKNGKYHVLITNPHTLAESVSLHTVCHDAVYFEYSYNLVHLLQSKDRIHRLGLPQNQYTQYYFLRILNQNSFGEIVSIDKKVYERLKSKEQTMLDAIDNHILEPVYTTDEDLEIIFNGLL